MLKRIDQVLPSLNSEMSERLGLLHAMTTSTKSRLPTDIAKHCWVSSFDEHSIMIITDSPAYSIFLRSYQQEILKQLNEEFYHITNFYWKKVRIMVSR